MFSGATGNQPSQYPHAVIPLTCSANRGHFSLNATYAYVGDPPERSGIIAASSAKNRHSSQPLRVTRNVTGTAAAPSEVTITGAIPVTRIVPARPMTNALHQFPVFGRPLPS